MRAAGVWALGSVPLVGCVGSETAKVCSDAVCQQEQTWETLISTLCLEGVRTRFFFFFVA